MSQRFKLLFQLTNSLNTKLKLLWQHALKTIDAHPMRSFWTLLILLLGLIVVGNIFRQPPKQNEVKAQTPKTVQIYGIGSAPKVTLQAKIEKSGALKLFAQSPGFVQSITASEGDLVHKGQNLFWLANNPSGGTLPTLSRQIAQKNYEFAANNFDLQIELINKRRDIANKTSDQAQQLRDITSQSATETAGLISLNQDILTALDSQLNQLQANSASGSADSLILQTKQAKTGVVSALNSLQTAQRTAQLQSDGGKAPAQLADLSKDLTLKQLDLEEKSLNLNREISQLNLRIAQVTESLMYPSSPCDGVIERVNIFIGQSVTPGALLATLTCNKNLATAVLSVSQQLAQNLSRIDKSVITVNNQPVFLMPRYISHEPTEGTLHTVIYDIPEEQAVALTNGSFITMSVPVAANRALSSDPFVPIDAIYQTQTEAFLYVAAPGPNDTRTATSRKVTLGSLFGEYIEVTDGLKTGDQVITNRNVIEGDVVLLNQ